MNSHRSRPVDAPRKAFARAGYFDAYDRSSTYSKAYVNSYNGYDRRPRRGIRYGDHLDHVFVTDKVGVSSWKVVAPLKNGKNLKPYASDHNAVRVTVWLP